jgi:large subunit ribosomal protein L16
MPLMPKRVKYRKSQRGSRKGTASRNLRINFGEFGLQTLERAWITNTQHEAQRQIMDPDFSGQISYGASAGNANG